MQLLHEAGRQCVVQLADTLIHHDLPRLADLVAEMKDSTEHLKAFAMIVEKVFHDLCAQVRVDVLDDGRLLYYTDKTERALEISGGGSVSVRAIVCHGDGTSDLITDVDTTEQRGAAIACTIANSAVMAIRYPRPSAEAGAGLPIWCRLG